jgi:hypothetical protein
MTLEITAFKMIWFFEFRNQSLKLITYKVIKEIMLLAFEQ